MKDLLKYGISIEVIGLRKWYNPMRWFCGRIYQKTIHPKDMYAEHD